MISHPGFDLRFTVIVAVLLSAACGASSPPPGDLGVWTPGSVPGSPSVSGSGVGDAAAGAAVASGASGSSVASSSASVATSTSSSSGTPNTTPSGVPCAVAAVLASKCIACHSDPPINGALSGLVTYADLTATAKEDPTKNEAQLSVVRMQSTSSPMPPTSFNNPATSSDISTLQSWIAGGYPAGSCNTSDGGAVDSGAVTAVFDVFHGRPAFASQAGPNSHNAGQNCMSCHSVASGEAPQFVFGGTLYNGSGQPVAGAEVRVVDKNGTGYSVYTGTNGNFYQTGAPLASPGHAGARNAASTALMISDVTSGGCASCHCTASGCTTTPIHLP